MSKASTLSPMSERLRYPEWAPEGIAAMRGVEHYLNTATALPAVLLELVRLRASLLNGCGFCVGHHTKQLRKHHEPETRIEALRDWAVSDAFTPRERAALAWTDAVTNIQGSHASDPEYKAIATFFEGKDLVDLTLAVASINAWNRLSIAFAAQWDPTRRKREPESAKEGASTPESARSTDAADSPRATEPDVVDKGGGKVAQG